MSYTELAKMTVSELKSSLASARNNIARVKEHAKRAAGVTLTLAEVGASAGGMGYLNGRYGKNGEYAVMGVPIDAGVGGALALLALIGVDNKYDEHIANVGAGCLASYAARKGQAYGMKAATAPKTTSGYLGDANQSIGSEFFGQHQQQRQHA